jgi:hypothetical protein
MHHAQLLLIVKPKFWVEVGKHSEDFNSSICTYKKVYPRYRQVHVINPPYINSLHRFGELVVSKNNSTMKAKSVGRGIVVIHIGTAKRHSRIT